MPLLKKCFAKGCEGYPAFGFGLPSKAKMRWACSEHRDLIWNAVPHTAAEGAGQGRGALVRPAPTASRQGRLW